MPHTTIIEIANVLPLSQCMYSEDVHYARNGRCEEDNQSLLVQYLGAHDDLCKTTSATAAVAPHTVPKMASIHTCSKPTLKRLPAMSHVLALPEPNTTVTQHGP